MTLPTRPDGKADWGLSNLAAKTAPLPTRANGGMTEKDLNLRATNIVKMMGEKRHNEYQIGYIIAALREAAAHTRERCANAVKNIPHLADAPKRVAVAVILKLED